MHKPASGKKFKQRRTHQNYKLRKRGFLRKKKCVATRNFSPVTSLVTIENANETREVPCSGPPSSMPRIVSFAKNLNETVKLISRLTTSLSMSMVPSTHKRANSEKPRPLPSEIRSYYEFEKIDEIGFDAALVIAALYHECSLFHSGRQAFTVNRKLWKASVQEALKDVGFLEFLSLSSDPVEEKKNSILMSAAKEGKLESDAIATSVAGICDGLLSDDQKHFLTTHIGEFITNFRQHAYLGLERIKMPDWWFYAHFDPATKKLRLAIYDVGFTIPKTLPIREEQGDKAQSILAEIAERGLAIVGMHQSYPDDGVLIGRACKTKLSYTEKPERGNGLYLLYHNIDDLEGVKVRILSRSGYFEKSSGEDGQSRKMLAPLKGTLISLILDL